jgi:hypothetical protein
MLETAIARCLGRAVLLAIAVMQPGVDILIFSAALTFHQPSTARGSPFRTQLKSRLRGSAQDRSTHGNGDKAVL